MREFETVSDLVRMALVYAVQDREAMLGALSVDDEYRPEVVRELTEFRAYLKKRFGLLTGVEADEHDLRTGKVRLVTLSEIKESSE